MEQKILDLETQYMKQRKRLEALEDRVLALEQGWILPKPEETDVSRDQAGPGASTE